MKNFRRKDGTVLTDEELKKVTEEINESSKPIGEYLTISELEEGVILPTTMGYVEIFNTTKNKSEIIFDLRFYDYVFANKVIYPISKEADKKDRIFSPRFLALIEWETLKNIDSISANVDLE